MLKYVPNVLTVSRFFLIPVIIYFILIQNYILAFIFLTISGLTDVLDGYIARRFNFITNFGKLIDPLADKATQISILVVLFMQHIIPLWILGIVVLKEFAMISGASFLYGKEFVVSSRWYGKLATVLFYIAIVCTLCIKEFNQHFGSSIFQFDVYIYYLAIIATLFSFIMYFRAFYMQGYLKKENLKIQKNNEKK